MKYKDLTEGPIFKRLFEYSIPIVVTNVVQLLFHAADVAVLSLMVDDAAVAAVGACGSIITLLVSLFTGFATGANVLVSKKTGAKCEQEVKQASGTALMLGLISGIVLMVFAVIFAKRILLLANCQPDVLEMATVYMRIYFLGMPITMLYNFASAVLRATGDSFRPMIFINVSGVLNVLLNVMLIGWFHMTVEGVALATVASKLVALVMILVTMAKKNCICRIERKNLRIRKNELFEIVRVGVPTCMASMFFYVANVVLGAQVNSMGTDAMTANAISGQFDGVIYTVGCAIAMGTAAMVGQNFGARRLDRIQKTMKVSALFVTSVSLALGISFVMLSEPLLGMMTRCESVIEIAKERMTLLCLTYFVTSNMELMAFSLRALRRHKVTMYVGAVCGFGIRVFWALLIWPLHPTLPMLYTCFSVSAAIACGIYFAVYRRTVRALKWEFSGDVLHPV